MKKEKYIISRKLIGGLLLKTIIVFGVFILAAAATMFMQSDKILAAKKKTLPVQIFSAIQIGMHSHSGGLTRTAKLQTAISLWEI